MFTIFRKRSKCKALVVVNSKPMAIKNKSLVKSNGRPQRRYEPEIGHAQIIDEPVGVTAAFVKPTTDELLEVFARKCFGLAVGLLSIAYGISALSPL